MSRRIPFTLALLAPLAASAAQPAWHRPVAVDGEIVVKLRGDAGPPAADRRKALGLSLKRALPRSAIEVWRVPAVVPTGEALKLVRAMPDVEYAEPNWLRFRSAAQPDDPLYGMQWALPAMNLPQAWDADGDGIADRTGDPSVVVAILDDAFDTAHRDLAANFLAGQDLADGDADPRPDDPDQLHGTAVAGCVAAVGDNGVGIASPAWNTRLLPLKISTRDDGRTVLELDAALAAYEAARAGGAQIVNASYGGPGFSLAERDAIRGLADDGILFVAAAGNEDSNIDRGQISYPANLDAENILAVAASAGDSLAGFS